MIAQRLIPALAVFSVAAAQSASICSQATATINSQADAAAYTGCSRIRGDVLIGPTAGGVITLDGPEEITGSLIAENAGGLTSFGSNTITKIGESFTLNNLTILSTLNMVRLTEVNEIAWTALQALDLLSFTAVVKKASSVVITNTFLSSLDGINLDTVNVLNINNNYRLREFSTQVGNITQSLIIDANSRQLEVSFPNLIWAANATFRNVSSVSIPSLASVNGTLGFYGNFFESLSAPNLTNVGRFSTGAGSLAFVANSRLTEIDMPLIETVGGAYQIANNSALTNITFPALVRVGGAVDFSGNFSTPDLPEMNDVRGGFNMQSTAPITCTGFDNLHSSKAIQGTFTCKTTADAKSADGTSTTGNGGSGTGSSPSSTGTNAAIAFGASQAVVGMSVFGGLLGMLL